MREDVLMSDYTTFRIGGKAKYFTEARDGEELKKAISFAREKELPFFILGNGSNILVSDNGYNGLIVKMTNNRIWQEDDSVVAEAGLLLSSLGSFCLKNSLTGLEWSTGIPGSLGGAVRGNAGAFESSMADLVLSVDFFNSRSGELSTLDNRACRFSYRESVFKKDNSLIILSVKLKKKLGDRDLIEAKMRDNLNYRREKHPQEPSAGSIFKGVKLTDRIKDRWPEAIQFKELIPAAFLIDKVGLKGEKIGGAMTSTVHPNFIINVGRAKAEDVVRLIKRVKEKVREEVGVTLEEEICYLGIDKEE